MMTKRMGRKPKYGYNNNLKPLANLRGTDLHARVYVLIGGQPALREYFEAIARDCANASCTQDFIDAHNRRVK